MTTWVKRRHFKRITWGLAVLGVIALPKAFWPKPDAYAFLRDLEPLESVGETYEIDSGRPASSAQLSGSFARTFAFTAPREIVWQRIAARWEPELGLSRRIFDGASAEYFQNPSGKTTALWLPSSGDPPSTTCVLVIWDEELSWLEKQTLRLRGIL